MMLAKIAAILMVVWFYQTAKENQAETVKWVIIGLIGYWLTWWLVTLTLANPILGTLSKNQVGMYLLVTHIPAVTAVIAAYFIRLKLLKDLPKN